MNTLVSLKGESANTGRINAVSAQSLAHVH